MIKHRITTTWGVGQSAITKAVEVEAGGESNLDEVIPAGSTNAQVAFAADVSQVKMLFITSDKALTIKTNSTSGSPNTITLVGGGVFKYIVNIDPPMRDTAGTAITTDIATLYVTNATGEDALLQIRCLVDPTI